MKSYQIHLTFLRCPKNREKGLTALALQHWGGGMLPTVRSHDQYQLFVQRLTLRKMRSRVHQGYPSLVPIRRSSQQRMACYLQT